MTRLLAACVLLLSACGSTALQPGRLPTRTVVLGTQSYTLDQLAPAPDDGSGVHLLYAVVRVTTSAPFDTVHASRFTLLDAAGHRYAPVRPAVYVPIDGLDGLTVSPGHTGAGVIAFPIPPAPPRGLLVAQGSASGTLDAP